MVTKQGAKIIIPDRYDKFDVMNACAEEWRRETVCALKSNTGTTVTAQRLILRLYNECLKYVNNGINRQRTIIPDVPEEEWSNSERYNEQIKNLEDQRREIEEKINAEPKGVARKEFLQTKKRISAKIAELETKLIEIEEWKQFAEYRKTEETLKTERASLAARQKSETDPGQKKIIKKRIREIEKALLENANNIQTIRNRWEQKEENLLDQATDVSEAWLSVLGEAFTQALRKFEESYGGPAEEKSFSLWLFEQLPNAKQRVGIIGSKLLVDPEDAYFESVNYNAKQYLKKVCRERNIKNFEMPRHVYTAGFLAEQLKKLGISAKDAAERAEALFAERNVSLNEEDENGERVIQNQVEHYLFDRKAERQAAKEAARQLLLDVYKAASEDRKLSRSRFETIRYYLTAQLFEKKLTRRKAYRHILEQPFYQKLAAEEQEAETQNRSPRKPHVLLAEMQKQQSETVRKKFRSAQFALIDYWKTVSKNRKENETDSY